ncbi:MAG TPA: AAA family ATPase [Streptosporangiaceae bacterium]|jgi:exonuclease SbcC|nr:AAA family ATPase [Streptosporangiaceae bacterium]
MRLHILEIRAFGPYAAPHRIDFDQLAASGLFLLEGPTGAGKSTILDAVTFALYGGLAGEDSGEDRLRSHFAGPGAEPSAMLEFSVHGARYRITRVPEHLRPKKRGEGFTTEASRVHLERMTAGGWSSLSSNKAEVGDAITEAVGLNREQFTQVMLLPQGEFARFLRARDDDRRELLTKLFGTQLYDRVTAELDRRRYDATRLREAADQTVSAAVSAAAEAAGLDAAARTEVLSLSRAERETRLKEESKALAETVAITGDGLEVASASVIATRTAAERAGQQAALMTRLSAALAALDEHERTRPEHELRVRRLAAARRADPVRSLLPALTEAESHASEARDALLRLAADADEDSLAGKGGRETAERADAKDNQAASLERLADLESAVLDRRAGVAELEQTAATAAQLVSDLEAAQQDLPEHIAALEHGLAAARSAAADLAAAVQQQAITEKQSEAASHLAELEQELAGTQAALAGAVDAHQHLVDEYQTAMEARLTGMSAELAAQLAEGVPCPVCGSTAHPAPACPDGTEVSADDIAGLVRLRDAAADQRQRLEDRRSGLAAEVAACSALVGGGTPDTLAAEAAAVAGRIAGAESAADDAARLEPELADRRAEQERVAEELRHAAAAAAAAGEQADQARASLAALEAELGEAAQGHPSVAARQAALRHEAARDRAVARAVEVLATALAAQSAAHDQAEQEAAAKGFTSLEEAREAVLDASAMAALETEVQAWVSRLAGLTSAAEAGDLAGLDPTRAGEIQAHANAAAEELTRAIDAEQEVRGAHDAARTRADRLRDRLADVRAAEESLDRLAEETEPVIRLAALVKGTDGHRRVSLTTYVLRHWFSQVVAAANVRLAAMSSGRYELKRTDEGDTRRERAGLTLAVIDRHTGTARSPASLSGGETFYTSLALALGLADVVRAEAGGVDLDTLFIDEGFGSLDSDTLDEVMAVIDDLRDRGRVVGIVSHVSDLKDRVPERLEVRRLADGSSTMKVVA